MSCRLRKALLRGKEPADDEMETQEQLRSLHLRHAGSLARCNRILRVAEEYRAIEDETLKRDKGRNGVVQKFADT